MLKRNTFLMTKLEEIPSAALFVQAQTTEQAIKAIWKVNEVDTLDNLIHIHEGTLPELLKEGSNPQTDLAAYQQYF